MVSALGRFVGVMVLAIGAANPAAACGTVLAAPPSPGGTKRAITASDLLGLRDIGFPQALAGAATTPFGVSPDGRSLAFVVTRADVAANRYCRVLVTMPSDGSVPPRVVDDAGEFRMHRGIVRGLFAEYGTAAVTTPRWSPDGRSIAYLKRTHGRTQVWLVDVVRGGSMAVTSSQVDVEAVAWHPDGRSLLIAMRPKLAALAAAVSEEGRSGWLYDDRMTPNAGAMPRVRADDAPLERMSLDLRTRTLHPATAAEQAVMVADDALLNAAEAAGGNDARVRLTVSSDVPGPASVVLEANGVAQACDAAACGGAIDGVWWDSATASAVFLRRSGFRNERAEVFRWRPGAPPRRLFTTDDALTGCVSAADALICGRENAVTPRRVVRIAFADGAARELYDPNPAFRQIELGEVRRLKWRNDRNLEAWGDLVLPRGYRPGTRLPMVIVQYHSRGFLRGGTNDEYPIHLFAARGIAVLSIERPPHVSTLVPGIRTAFEANAANFRDWADRRSVQSSLERGVAAAVATGAIDPARIGISGLSDGATTVRFALINSRLFAAAAISTCCVEPVTAMTLNGPRFADDNRKMGYPGLHETNRRFWQPMSITMNADRISTPLLMQVSDDEMLLALEAYEALRQSGKPVEMVVFPDEHHGKWQPVHRAAVYARNLDWFDFWLRNREDPAPTKQAQYQRWRELRSRPPS